MQGAKVTQTGNTAERVSAMLKPDGMPTAKIPGESKLSKADLIKVIKVRNDYVRVQFSICIVSLGVP